MEDNILIVEPEKPANTSVIWLHGLGADAHDFLPVIEQFDFPDGMAMRFIFPNAPVRPITLNGGAKMQGWYDIVGIGPEYEEDVEGILSSQKLIESLIEKEVQKGIPCNRIILIGFSQGGAIVLQTGIRYPKPLCALVALSTYLPLRHCVDDEIHAEQKNTPILFMHGIYDAVVPVSFAQHSYDKLKKCDFSVQWKEYEMQHTVCMEQISDINSFIIKELG